MSIIKEMTVISSLIQTNIRMNFEFEVNVNSSFNSLLSPISPIIFS